MADKMDQAGSEWMAYIDAEVQAACEQKGWRCQIRRKWSTRHRPVSESTVDDCEWKLIPSGDPTPPEGLPTDFDQGTYFVVSFDSLGDKLILQHDTDHCGLGGPHWHRRTYTEIDLAISLEFHRHMDSVREDLGSDPATLPKKPLETGWLTEQLLELTSRFQPNHFSIT